MPMDPGPHPAGTLAYVIGFASLGVGLVLLLMIILEDWFANTHTQGTHTADSCTVPSQSPRWVGKPPAGD